MGTIVRQINEIPSNIYNQVPSVIYDFWKNQLTEMSAYHTQIINKKIRVPKKMDRTLKSQSTSGTRFYIKSKSNLEYTITFKSKIDSFKLVLNDFFKQHNIHFDFDLCYNKTKLINDISEELSRITGLKLTIELGTAYITFIDNILIKSQVPMMIELTDCSNQQKLYFLIEEETFSVEALQLMQNQLNSFTLRGKYTKEQLIDIAEDIIEQYNGTLMPFTLYKVPFNNKLKV